jgi:CPA2 family monovalent cation:H+ antiporter-2
MLGGLSAVLELAVASSPNAGLPAHAALDVLSSLAIILCVAAATTVIFQRIHQPVVLGYLLAGLIVGPHMAVPLFADVEIAHLFSDLGVILLMFSLGLEFTLGKLARVAPTAGIVALMECSLMVGLGYAVTGLFGWTTYERLFAGAAVAISSTTIIVKAFAERGIPGRLGEIVFGILIVEDVIAIVLLAVLTTVASGAGLSATALAFTVARLTLFLTGMLVAGMFLVPRLVRAILRLHRQETTVVTCVGLCFASALLARLFGYSVALGAFLGGVLVAESGEAKTIEGLIEPVKDVFAAVFFVSVGMLIDPRLVATHWLAIAVLSLLVLGGKVIGVTLGSFIAGNGIRTSVQSGMSLAQIGEFSFIIVGVGLSLGVVRPFLYPVAVAISAFTTLLTPWLVRAAGPLASYADRRLPHALQTYAAVYGSWVAQLRSSRPQRLTAWTRIRRLMVLLVVDVALIGTILVATSLNFDRLARIAAVLAAAHPRLPPALVVMTAMMLVIPFVVGAIRVARALGLALAAEALPPDDGVTTSFKASAGGGAGLDLAAAPRRALLVTIQIAILLVAGLPLVAVAQPLWPRVPWAVLLLVALVGLAVPFWRGAANLHGHVRAGAQVILEALSSQSRGEIGGTGAATSQPLAGDIGKLVPGIGAAAPMILAPEHFGVGLSLKQIDLRGRTGASVIAIQRDAHAVFPSGDDVLRAGDTVVLTGTSESVDAARHLLAIGALESERA